MIVNVYYYDNDGRCKDSQTVEFDEMEINEYETMFYYEGEVIYIIDSPKNYAYYKIVKEEL